MKNLYTEDYRYTQAAQLLDMETNAAIKNIFAAWTKAEYSPREISQIIKAAITDFELEAVLGWDKL